MDQPGTGDSGYMVVCRLWFPAARVVQVLLQKSDHLVLKLCAVSDNVPTIIHFPNQPTQLLGCSLVEPQSTYESKTGTATWDGLVLIMINI